jgi:hypothetical protein
MEKDSTINRTVIIGFVNTINGWRRSGMKFGCHIVSADANKKVGILARERFDHNNQRNRASVYIDDSKIFDDSDLPPVEFLPSEDNMVRNCLFKSVKC